MKNIGAMLLKLLTAMFHTAVWIYTYLKKSSEINTDPLYKHV